MGFCDVHSLAELGTLNNPAQLLQPVRDQPGLPHMTRRRTRMHQRILQNLNRSNRPRWRRPIRNTQRQKPRRIQTTQPNVRGLRNTPHRLRLRLNRLLPRTQLLQRSHPRRLRRTLTRNLTQHILIRTSQLSRRQQAQNRTRRGTTMSLVSGGHPRCFRRGWGRRHREPGNDGGGGWRGRLGQLASSHAGLRHSAVPEREGRRRLSSSQRLSVQG